MSRVRNALSWARNYGTILRILLVLILLLWPLVYGSNYAMRVMTSAGLYALVTLSVVVILGQAGQLSFGHAAFYGIGAYVAGLLAMKLSVPTAAALIIGALAAGFVALIIGRPVLKLRYFYLALATIGLGQIFLVLVNNLRTVTGGTTGFAPVPKLSLFGFVFGTALRQYYLVWIIAFAVLIFLHRALKGRVGRAFRAIATSEIASQSLGVRTSNWKLLAFVTSAVICGLAGGLYAFVTTAVTPGAFTFTSAIIPIVMMLIGGGNSVWGAIIGAIVITWVINGFSGAQQYAGVAYSIVMILLLIFFPAGLALRPEQRAHLRQVLRNWAEQSPLGRKRQGAPCSDAYPHGEPFGSDQQDKVDPRRTQVDEGLEDKSEVLAPSEVIHSPKYSGNGPLLEIEGVSVHFGGLKAVDEVSLQVPEGCIVALIGPNGAGKSTLFNAISRLQKLTAGTIRFAGKDITKLSAADAARLGMARTFQNLRIYPNMTVLENVLVGCHRHERSGLWAGGFGLPHQRREEKRSREQAMQALRVVGLENAAFLPAASLPYGSQRLVEIARALASQPRLLLLDEPAAGMNTAERADLVERIKRICSAGVTVFLVEHDIELVMGLSEQVFVLDYGRLISQGRPEVVRNDPAVIEAYLGSELERRQDLCPTRELVSESCPEPEPMLVVENLVTAYGSIKALHGVSLTVPKGEVVAILGANGAGKTTLMHTISGLLKPTEGCVVFEGVNITGMAPEKIAAMGIRQVPEGRRLFRDLSVEDNLLVGTSGRRDWRKTLAEDVAFVYGLFPVLGQRRKQPAGTLSGGERQMLAIGRALVGRPKLLLLDEPSMGLAPMVVEHIFEALAELNRQGMTILMVEQSAEMALSLAHRAVVLQTGRVVAAGLAEELKKDDRVRSGYFGV
ncbi:MAG: ATP-binding cassette domain-containing protein [Thermoleophilia bacterium]|nr:ATP-binding cassette domain-containing protein [Thermoleophilia bacterium]